MTRPVYVTTRDVVVGADGSVLVTQGREGTVVAVSEPPTANRYLVRFTTNGSPLDVWLNGSQISWRDGIIGPIRAVIQSNGSLITDCDFTRLYSTTDLVINDRLTYISSSIDFKTDDGYIIRVSSNLNNDLMVEYLAVTSVS